MDIGAAIELLENDIPSDPPEGYRQIDTGAGFNVLFGPVFGRMESGRPMLGIRVSNRHINPHKTCHGGVLATFADFQAYIAHHQAGLRDIVTPTINMTVDFLSPAVLGDWLEARTELVRATRSMIYSQTLAFVGDRPVFRSNSIFKIGKPAENPGSALGDFFLRLEEHSK